jgi:hypothetical protein
VSYSCERLAVGPESRRIACGSRIFVAIGLLDFSASPLHPDIKPCGFFPGLIF